MLINPSIIILNKLSLFCLDLFRMSILYNIYLRLILLLCNFFDTVTEIYFRWDLGTQRGKLVVELLAGKIFLSEESLLLVEHIDFVGLLERLYLKLVLELALREFLGSFIDHVLFVSNNLP